MDKPKMSPEMCASYEEKTNRYDIQVELPGVKKTDIDLEMLPGGFMLKAPRDDLEYIGDYNFCCDVDSDRVEAKFDNGLLTIRAPLKQAPQKPTRISVR